jgi:hypothetical protein
LVLRGGGKLQAGIDLKFTSSQDSTGDRCGCFHLSQYCKYKSEYIYDLQHIICTITRVAAVEGIGGFYPLMNYLCRRPSTLLEICNLSQLDVKVREKAGIIQFIEEMRNEKKLALSL